MYTAVQVVVLEIGCGKRIPTVRNNSERIIRSTPMGQVRLVRIFPQPSHAHALARTSADVLSAVDL